MRKLSLVAALLLLAFALHAVVAGVPAFRSAHAADAVAAAEEGDAAVAPDEGEGFFCPCANGWRGHGQRGFMRRNRQGSGPGMAIRPRMGRQGWRGWNGDGDDTPRFRRIDRDDRGERSDRGDRNERFGALGPRFMDELELTDEQRRQMIDIATENFRERLTLRWEMEKAQNALEDLRDGESKDYDAIVAANEALGGARGRLDVARRKVMEQFAAVLTPEQREKIEQYRGERREDRGEERGNE